MNFYDITIDEGRRRKFACGHLEEIIPIKKERRSCPDCSGLLGKNYFQLFNDKNWNAKMYMDREHYADFMSYLVYPIVSEKAKEVLTENFGDAVDFGDIEMVSYRDLTVEKLKDIRDTFGYPAVKKIPNDPPQLYRLLLKQGADLDFEKSNIKLTLDCLTCGSRVYDTPYFEYSAEHGKIIFTPTVYIKESTWKGYDIFHVEGYGSTVFCTEKFIEIYNQHKLTGLRFLLEYLKVETI